MTLTMHADEDEHTFLPGDDDMIFVTNVSEPPQIPTIAANDESFHFHHPPPSFPSPTLNNDRRCHSCSRHLVCVQDRHTKTPRFHFRSVSYRHPRQEKQFIRHSRVCYPSLHQLFPSSSTAGLLGANRTADTSPRDTTLTSRLADQTHTTRRRGSAPTEVLSVLITTTSLHKMPSTTQAVITSLPSSRVTASNRRGGDVIPQTASKFTQIMSSRNCSLRSDF